MVTDLIKRYGLVKNNLEQLEQALKDVGYKGPQDLTDAQIDLVIKKFGYSVDTFWKYLMAYKDTLGIKVEENDPVSVLNECVSAALITKEEFDVLTKMLDDYKKVDQTYDTIWAQELYTKVPAYYQTMKTVVDRQPSFE